MGELLRRYWYPVAAESELRKQPIKGVTLLGERLVLFRDAEGHLGLLPERCPHRGTSLTHGIVDHEGLACPYHGWKFDRQGRCLDLPAEPPDSPLRDRVRLEAAHVESMGGLIWAYLGPEPAPLLPRFDLFVWDNCLRDIGQAMVPCHWLQLMENSVDPHHLEHLHGKHLAYVRGNAGLSVPTHYQRRHEKVGFDLFPHGIIKRRVLAGNSEADDDWKVGHPLIFPCMLRVGSGGQHRMQIRVPIDETHTWHLWYACYRPADPDRQIGQTEIPLYDVPWQTESRVRLPTGRRKSSAVPTRGSPCCVACCSTRWTALHGVKIHLGSCAMRPPISGSISPRRRTSMAGDARSWPSRSPWGMPATARCAIRFSRCSTAIGRSSP